MRSRMAEWCGWAGAVGALLFVTGVVFYGPGLRASSTQLKSTPAHAVVSPAMRAAHARRS